MSELINRIDAQELIDEIQPTLFQHHLLIRDACRSIYTRTCSPYHLILESAIAKNGKKMERFEVPLRGGGVKNDCR